MYLSRRRQTYVKGGPPFYLWLLTHLFVLDTPVWPNIVRHGKSSSVRLRVGSIGISPPPGTPQAAPFGYWSIIIPHVCHRPLSVVIRLHSKYRLIAPSVKGDLGAPFELGLFTPRKYNVGKVLDEWVFCFQRSLRFILSTFHCHRFQKKIEKFLEKFFQLVQYLLLSIVNRWLRISILLCILCDLNDLEAIS